VEKTWTPTVFCVFDGCPHSFGILEQEAVRRQLFLFTCREDVRDQALARGAHLVSLP